MTVKYCDFINGDDTTGDGSRSNPYKTITQASTGLTGGDEVRVAKSPGTLFLAGTFSFTNGSTSVVSTDDIFIDAVSAGETDGSVRLGDFIQGGDGNWWEVVSVKDSKHANIFKAYSGATSSAVSSQKLGVTSTGAAPSLTAAIQNISASGTSLSTLKIRGGWDLSTDTQNGETFFIQLDSSAFSNRYGYGLQLSSKKYVEIERCHFLRYLYGIYLTNSPLNIIQGPICMGNSSGIYLSYAHNNSIIQPICNGNSSEAIFLSNSTANIISMPTCNSNSIGIKLAFAPATVIFRPVCNNNLNYGINAINTLDALIYGYTGAQNGSDIYISPNNLYSEFPCAKCQDYQTAGLHKCFYEFGTTERDTANARGGSGECLKYSPASADYYISQSFYFKADSGVGQTLSAYIKKNSAFNGSVQGAVFFSGKAIVSWTNITPSTADVYEQKSLTVSAGDIAQDGVLELRIKVKGTSGNVFVDDLSTS